MKILGLIPARGGSKGIPNKNIKILGGQELICYTIHAALGCMDIDQVLVSTDDERIARISQEAGATVPFIRPSELATDSSPTIDTVFHALKFCESQGTHFGAVCLLQATVPFRRSEDISAAIKKFKSTKADSLISVREVPHIYNPHWVFEEKSSESFLKISTGEEKIISRRQDLPKAYHRDGSIYLTLSEVILKERSLYGKKIAYHLMEDSPSINLDTPADWMEAEKEIAKRKK